MWLVIGILVGVLLLAVINWTRSKNIAVAWYTWLIGLVGLSPDFKQALLFPNMVYLFTPY